MSLQVSLDLGIHGVSSLWDLLTALKRCGWSWCNSEGKVEYLPLHDEDRCDWQIRVMDDAAVMDLVVQKEALHEPVGIHLFTKENRQFYALERLWGDAPQLDTQAIIEE